VVAVDVPGVAGDEAWFVVLGDGAVVAEEGDADLSPLAATVALERPFRAHALRRNGSLWVVAARRIDTVALSDDPGGDEVELAWDGTERTVRIDGEPTLVGVPELERLGAARHGAYVVTAARLVGSTWEVSVAPL
jgi:hypothetical protein